MSKPPKVNVDDLSIISLQDTGSSKGMSAGMNAGVGSNGSLSSVGVNGSSSKGNTAWVSEQSDITGSGSVKVTVANNTHLEGGLIANATTDENGNLIDQGNLTLTTKTLTVANLNNEHDSISMGAGLNAGGNTVSISAQYGGEERKGLPQATIGQGALTITEGTEPENLNRELTQANIVTEEHTVGGLNANLTVDTRMFSEKGRASIQKDFIDTGLHAEELYTAVKETATTDQGILDTYGRVQELATNRETMAALAAQEALHKQLIGDEGAEGNQDGLKTVGNALAEAQGVDATKVNLYDGEQTPDDTIVGSTNDFNKQLAYSGYDTEGKEIYVNVDTVDMTNSGMQVNAMTHETARSRMDQQNSTYDATSQTTIATNEGNLAQGAWEAYSGLYGYSTTSTSQTSQDWLDNNRNSTTVTAGTKSMLEVDSGKVEPWARQEAIGLVTQYPTMAMYPDPTQEGGWGVALKDQAASHIMQNGDGGDYPTIVEDGVNYVKENKEAILTGLDRTGTVATFAAGAALAEGDVFTASVFGSVALSSEAIMSLSGTQTPVETYRHGTIDMFTPPTFYGQFAGELLKATTDELTHEAEQK